MSLPVSLRIYVIVCVCCLCVCMNKPVTSTQSVCLLINSMYVRVFHCIFVCALCNAFVYVCVCVSVPCAFLLPDLQM